FWGKGWSWADTHIDAVVDKASARAAIVVADLGLHIAATSTLGAAGASLALDVTAAQDVSAVGGGIELDLVGDGALALEGDVMRVHTARGDVLLRCTGFASLEREPNTGALRAFVAKDRVAHGAHSASIVVAAAGASALKSVPPRAALFDRADPSLWPTDTLAFDGAPIDLSYLNERPAGKHGRIKARGADLVFDDGTPVRLWGTNIQAYPLFTGTDAEIKLQAKRLAAFGYNLVRIHHHDSAWVTPNVIDTQNGTSQTLDEKSLERLDFWIKALHDEGIYTWIDLHVGRRFQPGDQIPGYDELLRNQDGQAKGFAFLNDRVGALMDSFARAYLTRKNRYSGVSLADDPAVPAVLITNEDDLVSHYGNLFLADKNNPVHQRIFDARAAEFAARTSLSVAALKETWKPGPSKLFLADLEHRFFDARAKQLRALGYRGLLAFGSTWGDEDAVGLYSLAGGDIVDVHSYGGVDEVRKADDGFLSWIAAASVSGKPLSISEWNLEHADDRFTAPLRMAAVASLQGWDAPMLYGWLQEGPGAISQLSPWTSSMDPSIAALMPAAALLYRRGDVAPAPAIDIAPTRAQIIDASLSPRTSRALRTVVERARVSLDLPVTPALPWWRPAPPASERTLDVDADAHALPAPAGVARDADRGTFVVDSERSVVFSGFVGGAALATRTATAHVDTKAATVALTSLDGAPLSSSQRMLLSWAARSVGSGGGEQQPVHAEPVRGSLSLASARTKLALIPLDAHGARLPARALARVDNRVLIPLPADLATHWALVEAAP
ncbi:MAG TPA: cellulase family glycosylhydrolase, partial [Myxococcota bacterium]